MKHSGSTMKHSGGTMKQFQKPISSQGETTACPRGVVFPKRFPAESYLGWESLRSAKVSTSYGGYYKN
jgi:hypothetical protein